MVKVKKMNCGIMVLFEKEERLVQKNKEGKVTLLLLIALVLIMVTSWIARNSVEEVMGDVTIVIITVLAEMSTLREYDPSEKSIRKFLPELAVSVVGMNDRTETVITMSVKQKDDARVLKIDEGKFLIIDDDRGVPMSYV